MKETHEESWVVDLLSVNISLCVCVGGGLVAQKDVMDRGPLFQTDIKADF